MSALFALSLMLLTFPAFAQEEEQDWDNYVEAEGFGDSEDTGEVKPPADSIDNGEDEDGEVKPPPENGSVEAESIEDSADQDTLKGPPGFVGKSGVTAQSLALPDGSGTMQGMGESFTPNLNTGSGTFSVPIAIPPGRRGMQPQIGMAYSTGSGDGPIGWGWAMGTPFISRQVDKGMPLYTTGDRFMYNGGQELVPIDMPSDEDWPSHVWDCESDDVTYYRARIEGGFMRFFYNATEDSWLVQDRQGNHYFYGESDDEKIIGPKGTYQWSLTRMADIRRATSDGGNDVHYVYLQDGRNLYISDIFWNSYEHEYGALSKYQHNIHFEYSWRPDPSVSYANGFAIEQNLRLERIEVSSFQYEPGGQRQPTRAYFLTYEDESHSIHSKLSSVKVCGRDWEPGGGGTCMPPLEFTYSRITGVSPDGTSNAEFVEGFGYFNEMTRDFSVSPDVSVEDANVEFMDINQDGLPDLLVTQPDYFGDDHAAIINDGLGGLDSEEAVRIDNPASWSLHLENMNVSLMDMDGAGNADLLHMPYGEEYSFFRLKQNQSAETYYWEESEDIPINQNIDFTSDSMDIRLVDINNDHLIDVVRSTGSRMQHFLNLSAFPGYEGQFGHLDDNGQPVPDQSIDTCLLYRGSIMQFHDGNLQFGDMNGDGVQDIVDMKSGNIGYWPGRGYGQWGDSDEDCMAGEVVDNLDITMDNSPVFFNPDNEGVSIADLNGDGLSDILEIKFDSVAIWLNRGNNAFSERHIIYDTPFTNSGFYSKVRLADVNGSGTVDIVWADAGGYQFIDLAGDYRAQSGNNGLPAGLLEQVNNGLGASTYMEYATSTELMVDAREQGNAWSSVAPMPLTVIKKVTTTDNLHLIGGPEGLYTQEYVYRDPYYDGPEAEFKGFGYAEAWDRERDADGDGQMDAALCSETAIKRGEAPIVGRNWFHRGVRPECMETPDNDDWPDWGPESRACSQKQHEDNPMLGLTGVSIKSDVYSPCTGKVISASAAEIEVRQLFESSDIFDERNVVAIVPNDGRVYKYDLSAPQGSGASETYAAVTLVGTPYTIGTVDATYQTASQIGSFHRVVAISVVDDHGLPREVHHGGFHPYTTSYPYDKASCDGFSNYSENEFDPASWLHTQTETWSEGPGPANENSGNCSGSWMSADIKFDWQKKNYTQYGELDTNVITYFGVESNGSGGYQVSSTASEYYAFRDFNDYGQEIESWSRCQGNDRNTCLASSQNNYQYGDGDDYYSAYIRQVHLLIHDTEAPVQSFTTTARWDAGFAQIKDLVSLDGSQGSVEYDALGRFKANYGANPETGELCESAPVKEVFYNFGTAPMPYTKTVVNTESIQCESQYEYENTVGLGGFEPRYTYVDALGRPFAVLSQGDHVLNNVGGESSRYPWLISGYFELNAKGNLVKSCENSPIDGPVFDDVESVFALQPKDLNCSYLEFDAYGQTVATYSRSSNVDSVNGYVVSRKEYHLDSIDSCDHLDLYDSCHEDTCSTQRVDGLQRIVSSTTRHRPVGPDGVEDCAGEMVERKTSATYEFGAVVASQEENGIKISRRQLMDSLGRMRVNLDINFGAWYYGFNSLGELVNAVSPTGNQSQYQFDATGRIKREYYNGVLESEYFYDVYPGDSTLGLDQVTDWSHFPSEYAVTIGKLVAVKDRTGVSISAANYGNFSESWRVLYPEDRLYHSVTLTDHSGRLEYAIDQDGDKAWAEYYPDGVVKSSYWSDYDAATDGFIDHQIIKRIKSNYLGQTELVEYGDAANTVMWSGYDPVTHQPMQTVIHQQSTNATLVAFGYEYDAVGKLTGIVDWRGRDSSSVSSMGLNIGHPSQHQGSHLGANYPDFPDMLDEDLSAPSASIWNDGTEPDTVADVISSDTGWPLGVAPSDARFEYDTLYQLVGEERFYVNDFSGSLAGYDFPILPDGTAGPSRVRSLSWSFDQRGSMTSWEEDGANVPDPQSLGRALGKTIVNGFQLNQGGGCNSWLSTNNSLPPQGTCYIPDALYFASNIDPDSGPGAGRGTCVWVEYDQGSRMTSQHIRIGCNTCTFDDKPWDTMVDWATNCPGALEEGAHGTLEYKPAVDASYISYGYSWNARGQLAGAAKYLDGDQKIAMSYVYDASGLRVLREKSDVTGGQLGNIRQDIYLGGIEHRQVSLIDNDDSDNPVSINEALSNIWDGTSDLGRYNFNNINGTKLVKYPGIRVQWEYDDLLAGYDDPQLFLSFGNHLGSTSAVIDYSDGTLVEWKTNYAYGADETGWKNGDEKYGNADEPYGFTGKEEDEAVGLHYFGARYYSSYLGRWISPDPPVVHNVGLSNYYNYGANSPFISVDPDGNSPLDIIGKVKNFFSALANGGSFKEALKTAVVGIGVEILTDPVDGVGSWLFSAGCSMIEAARSGGDFGDIAKAGMMAAVWGIVSDGITKPFVDPIYTAIGSVTSMSAISDINANNWDEIVWSVGFESVQTHTSSNQLAVDVETLVWGTDDKVSKADIELLQLGLNARYHARGDSGADGFAIPSGWREVSDRELRSMGISSKELDDRKSGFRANIYKNRRTREYVIAFRGTEMSDPEAKGPDLRADFVQGAGLKESQYESAISIAKRVKCVAGNNMSLVGNSLGGGLATAAGLVTNTKVLTTNSAGVHPNTLARHGADSSRAHELVKNYYHNGDLLSAGLQDNVNAPAAVGKRIKLTGSKFVSPVDLHYAENIYTTLFQNYSN
ncbi:MAG: hypothetical protein GY847_42120 [Proteobacteria bacterium]|nr:hypothetical protein [Pseudomonadota bacterium]